MGIQKVQGELRCKFLGFITWEWMEGVLKGWGLDTQVCTSKNLFI